MTDLSPAAQAVFYAFNSKFDWIEDGVPGPQFNAIAAALRAVVEHLSETHAGFDFADKYGRFVEADDILAIAAELEAQ